MCSLTVLHEVNSLVMAIDTSRFGKALLEADGVDGETLSNEPFAGLDLRAARCFGFSPNKDQCWVHLVVKIDKEGRDNVDLDALEHGLTADVEKSYIKIAEFKLVDINTDIAYVLWFDNNKELWGVQIKDSPKAEMSIEERADFFKSEMFKKIAKKTYYCLLKAKKAFDGSVKQEVESGEMMLVDVVKLDAIMHFLDSEHFLQNLLAGKYLGY